MNYSTYILYCLRLIVFCVLFQPFFSSSPAEARNPDLSLWTQNLSESVSPTELQEVDFNQEIAVVGTTVHVIWMTRNLDWSGYKLFYRRSTDNGATWEAKKLVFESDDMITDNSYRRMAVSGNYVHIAINHYEGSWYGVLTYCRSSNNGASFESPRTIFTASGAYHVYDVYVAAEGADVTIGYRHQCNWKVDNAYMLKISSDNGDTFLDRSVYGTQSGSSWRVSDMQRINDNIYVLYSNSYYYYGMQYGRLYIASSVDAGETFNSIKVSVASLNGEDKTSPLQDYHYVPKIAGEGDNVSVIWSGLNELDVLSVYYCQSNDSGATWSDPLNLTDGLLPEGLTVAAGQETVTTKGGLVYSVLVTTSNTVFLRRSDNSGTSFYGLQELTSPGTPWISQGWWPVIKTDPGDASGETVYIMWTYPTYVYSNDGGATFTKPELISPYFSYSGAYASSALSPQMAIGSDQKIHFTIESHYYSNNFGGYGDMDIFYRGFSRSTVNSDGNKALRVVSNNDDARFDNMQVPASTYLNFKSTMTCEIWVKPAPGGVTTGSTAVSKPIFHKMESGYNFAYALQTFDRYGQRQAQAQIQTTDGAFWLNPSNATEGLVPDNEWSHMAFSYDASGGENNFKLYLNGQLIAVTTATGDLITADGLFFVGKYGNWDVDELRLWNVERTQTEIFAGMNKTLAGTESGLTAYYNFDGNTRDISGNGNDGILMYQESYQAGHKIILQSDFLWNLFLPATIHKIK